MTDSAAPRVAWPSDLTTAAVLAACPTGPPAGPRAKVLKSLYDGAPSPPVGATVVWVADLLIGQLGAERIYPMVQVLSERRPPAVPEDGKLMAALTAGRAAVLAVTAGRFVSLYGTPGAYDADAGEWVDRPPLEWLETRLFNVRELVRGCLDRIKTPR